MKLLLLSNSTSHGRSFLEHALEPIAELLQGVGSLVFVPYARNDLDDYTALVRAALRPLDVTVTGAHTSGDPAAALAGAEAVFIGGGNTFRLLRTLHEQKLLAVLREHALAGRPYLGSSAGTNMACPSLRTTNDMPIVQPPSFEALGLVPFQINPHYLDPVPGSTHMGETRETRILEFLEDNDVPVLGIREGAWLRVDDGTATLGGENGARLFARDRQPAELPPGADVSFLLSPDLTGDTGR